AEVERLTVLLALGRIDPAVEALGERHVRPMRGRGELLARVRIALLEAAAEIGGIALARIEVHFSEILGESWIEALDAAEINEADRAVAVDEIVAPMRVGVQRADAHQLKVIELEEMRADQVAQFLARP